MLCKIGLFVKVTCGSKKLYYFQFSGQSLIENQKLQSLKKEVSEMILPQYILECIAVANL